MSKPSLSEGVVHSLPKDLKTSITNDRSVVEIWENITPLARNEWICWVENAKKVETRQRRIARVSSDLKAGKRRPCCWPGCPHRQKK
ncbi:hypothetical protein DZA50_04600 [Kangiella sp. HD9-110m-PIT-SAG07]|nr:hypothetical protein DZA50_04600 [Kangiella sp. HD9-110m-PIT-SAG07]